MLSAAQALFLNGFKILCDSVTRSRLSWFYVSQRSAEIIFSEIKQEIMYLLAIHLTEIFSYNHLFLSLSKTNKLFIYFSFNLFFPQGMSMKSSCRSSSNCCLFLAEPQMNASLLFSSQKEKKIVISGRVYTLLSDTV